jgi:hypothetical protein
MIARSQKGRKRKTLSRREAVRRIDEMTRLVQQNVLRAIHDEAALRVGNITVAQTVDGKTYYGAECYNSIRLALALNLALTLAKLFDAGARSKHPNRRDVASIPLLLRLLAQKRCRRVLQQRARSWNPDIPGLAESNARECEDQARAAVHAFQTLQRRAEGRAGLKALRTFRNKMLAHTLLDVALRRLPQYRQLFILLKAAKIIVGHVQLAVQGNNLSLDGLGRERRRQAKAFWTSALNAAKASARDY